MPIAEPSRDALPCGRYGYDWTIERWEATPTEVLVPDEDPSTHMPVERTALSTATAVLLADGEALAVAYETARALLQARSPDDVRDALVALVERLGGEVGPAALEDRDVIPVDLSLGTGEPLLPRAEPGTLTRLRLELLLPGLAEDGRALAGRLGGDER